ncbi:MAG: VWA domain-containing protein, partial [Rhodospirillales bacterium]
MFIDFFFQLRAAKVPVSLREYLTLLEAMDEGLADYDVNEFYYLSRSCLVKDETNLDKFDRVFGHVFKGLENASEGIDVRELPEAWLKKLVERYLSEEEKREIEAL